MKTLSFLLFCVMSLGAAAQNTVTIQEITEIVLLRGTSKVATHDSWESCERDMDRRARAETQTSGTRTFACQTEKRKVVATYGPAPVVPPPPPPVAPVPPANVTDDGTVLSWTPPTLDVNGNTLSGVTYSVEQRFNGAAYAVVATDVAPATLAISGLAPGDYCWRVYAKWVGGASGPSNAWCKTIEAPPPVTPPPTGSGYTLQRAVTGSPFAVALPAPPVIDREQAVTPSTITQHINTPRTRLVLGAGTYGDRQFGSQDQEVVLSSEAIVGNIEILASARRIKIRGQTPRAGRINTIYSPYSGGPQDITVDGANIDALGSPSAIVLQGNRIAVINSRLRARQYAISSMPDNAGNRNTDHVYANNDAESWESQSGVRLMNVDRVVFVDSRVKKTNGLVFRLHGDAGGTAGITNAYIARNQFEGLGGNYGSFIASGSNPNNTPAAFGGIVFENNSHYCQCGLRLGDPPPTSGRATGNRFYGINGIYAYGSVGGAERVVASLPGWTLTPNEFLPAQTPPGWNYR